MSKIFLICFDYLKLYKGDDEEDEKANVYDEDGATTQKEGDVFEILTKNGLFAQKLAKNVLSGQKLNKLAKKCPFW